MLAFSSRSIKDAKGIQGSIGYLELQGWGRVPRRTPQIVFLIEKYACICRQINNEYGDTRNDDLHSAFDGKTPIRQAPTSSLLERIETTIPHLDMLLRV